MVKTTPPATDSPADPMVWTMLFSRIVEPPKFLQHRDRQHRDRNRRADRQPGAQPEIDRGGAESRPNSAPRTMAFSVNSAGD